MTLLGKVFTGLIFLLSVIFFALAIAVNATHLNQKTAAAKFKAQATTAEQRNTQLSTLLEDYKTDLAIEQAARRSALASLQTQFAAAEQQLSEKEKEVSDVRATNTLTAQTLSSTQSDLKATTDENKLLRDQIKQAREDRDQIFQRLVSAKDEYNRLQGVYQSLNEREKALASNYTQALEKLSIMGIKPSTQLEAPPAVNGEITAVDTSNLVEVSLGRDDGMRAGFTLEVHRNGQYLGRLKVRTVKDDKSTAEILTSYQKGYIRVGDRVDSKLF